MCCAKMLGLKQEAQTNTLIIQGSNNQLTFFLSSLKCPLSKVLKSKQMKQQGQNNMFVGRYKEPKDKTSLVHSKIMTLVLEK